MSVSSFIFPISTSSSLPPFLSLATSSAFSLKNSSFSSLLCKQTVITNKTEENMLWGKRPPPMKRTTSLNEIIFDLGETPPSYQSDDHQNNHCNGKGVDQSFLSMVSPRNNNNHGRHSADFLETSNFLKACGLCKRKLVPGRDIYMYRGDSAFCSLECRQQQMNQDERKEKCSNASSKKQAATSSSTTGSQVSAKGGTVATV